MPPRRAAPPLEDRRRPARAARAAGRAGRGRGRRAGRGGGGADACPAPPSPFASRWVGERGGGGRRTRVWRMRPAPPRRPARRRCPALPPRAARDRGGGGSAPPCFGVFFWGGGFRCRPRGRARRLGEHPHGPGQRRATQRRPGKFHACFPGRWVRRFALPGRVPQRLPVSQGELARLVRTSAARL